MATAETHRAPSSLGAAVSSELLRIRTAAEQFDWSPLERVLVTRKRFTSDAAKKLVKELSRFLVLKALLGDLDASVLSPSGPIDTAWHELLLMPTMYLDVCTRLLRKEDLAAGRLVIGHNPLGGHDGERAARLRAAVLLYRKAFGECEGRLWRDDVLVKRLEEALPPEQQSIPYLFDLGDCELHGTVKFGARSTDKEYINQLPTFVKKKARVAEVVDHPKLGWCLHVGTSPFWIRIVDTERRTFLVFPEGPEETVQTVMARIQAVVPFSLEYHRLLFEGQRLFDRDTLGHWRVESGDALMMAEEIGGC